MRMRMYGPIAVILGLMLLAACGKRADGGEAAARGSEASEPEARGSEAHEAETVAKDIVALSDASLANLDVETDTARIGSLGLKLRIPGRIVPDANRTAKVTASLEGRLLKLDRDVGDRVAQGAAMGTLETPELLDRPQVLRSPIAGVVTERNGSVGELIGKGQAVFTISDPGHLWLIGEVKEQDLALIQAGQDVEFGVAAYPGTLFHGKIGRVGNSVETETRTFEVRVETGSQGGKLRPGMFAEMEVTTGTLNGALLVSEAALQTEGEGQIAFVALDANRFEKRAVKTGREAGGRVQILAGIRAGERVVTEGSFTLKSEMLKGELGEE